MSISIGFRDYNQAVKTTPQTTPPDSLQSPPPDLGVLSLSIEERVQELRKMYGTCGAAYILHDIYKLSYTVTARLLGVTEGTVSTCVRRARLKQQLENILTLPVALSPAFENFKEVCKDSAISVECQMLETEAFMFDVTRQTLPASTFWDVFIFAKATHRVVFPDIYNFLTTLAGMDLKKQRKLFRAVRVKDRWYVGDGLVAYTFNLLDKSCFHRGYSNPRLTFNILATIERLARKNPMREPLVYLSMVVSDKLAYLISMKRTEIMQTMKEVYATLTRMYDLD